VEVRKEGGQLELNSTSSSSSFACRTHPKLLVNIIARDPSILSIKLQELPGLFSTRQLPSSRSSNGSSDLPRRRWRFVRSWQACLSHASLRDQSSFESGFVAIDLLRDDPRQIASVEGSEGSPECLPKERR